MGDSKMHGAKKVAALTLGGVVVLGASTADAAFVIPDLTTGGTSTAGPGTSPTNEAVANAFDDNASTKVLVFSNPSTAVPITIDYDFLGTTAQVVRSYSLTSANDAPERDPAQFRLLASNDNFATAPVVIDTRTGINFPDGPDADALPDRGETIFFTVANTTAFQQYRLEIQESRDPANDRPQIAEIQLFATSIPEPGSLIGVMTLGGLGLLRRRRKQ